MVYLSGVILECPGGPQMVALGTPPLYTPHVHRACDPPLGRHCAQYVDNVHGFPALVLQ